MMVPTRNACRAEGVETMIITWVTLVDKTGCVGMVYAPVGESQNPHRGR